MCMQQTAELQAMWNKTGLKKEIEKSIIIVGDYKTHYQQFIELLDRKLAKM